MATAVPPPPPSRDPLSHIARDGTPKRTYATEHLATIEVARLEAQTGVRFTWYVCGQRPEHWHIARSSRRSAP